MDKLNKAQHLALQVLGLEAIVQVNHTGRYWETIAAFNSGTVAHRYAAECQASADNIERSPRWQYRSLEIETE